MKMLRTMEDVPRELVISILVGLPAEDVLRCKSVCKSFYSIITSPTFMDMRWKISRNKCFILSKYYILRDLNSNLITCRVALLSNETLEVVDSKQVVLSHLRTREPVDYVDAQVMSCCNGVVCVRIGSIAYDEYFLWNPATRDTKIIPPQLFYKTNNGFKLVYNGLKLVSMGFGFDPKNSDFKLVSIQQEEDHNEVEVYSVNTGGWRLCDTNVPPFDMLSMSFGITCGQMCSWLFKHHLVSFDFCNDVFITTPLPPDFIYRRSFIFSNASSLTLINGVPEGVDGYSSTRSIWELGEYGVKDSWTYQFSVGQPYKYHSVFVEVLLGLKIVNLSKDMILKKIRDVFSSICAVSVYNYEESLLPIKATRLLPPFTN